MGQRPTSLATTAFPTIGKIKIGEKHGRSMRAIDKFRFLSSDRESMESIAEAYGGTVRPFSDAKSQFTLELYCDASEIPIILPPNPLGDGPRCELFGGKGIERRCNLTDCEIEQDGPEGKERITVPCICDAEHKYKCDVRTRMSVVLPICRFGGTWTIETKSDFAAREWQAMVATIQAAGQLGMTRAKLGIDSRISRSGAHKFKVPRLILDHTFEELVAGAAAITGGQVQRQLEQPAMGAIGPGANDMVVDAEIVDLAADRINLLKLAGAHLQPDQRAAAGSWREANLIPQDPASMSDDEFHQMLEHLRSYPNI